MLKQVLALALLAACADAFSITPASFTTISKNQALSRQSVRVSLRTTYAPLSVSMAAVSSSTYTKPAARVKPSKAIDLYVYDHCPFCVRARLIFGLKNIKYTLNFMANDEVDVPTKLVGKKVAPIMEIKEDAFAMPESMDIVKRIDEDLSLGPPVLQPATDRADLKAWQKTHQDCFRELQRPRYVMTGLLPEFAFASARETFIKNHQMPGFEKADWKSDKYSMEFRKGLYQKAFEETATHLAAANAALKELEVLIYSPQHCSPHGVSYDDIDLFSRLRSMTIVKGIQMGPKVSAYMEHFSKVGDIPLYTGLAM